MRNIRRLLIVVFAGSFVAISQEVKHAPTLEQCTADMNLWAGEIPGWPAVSAVQNGTRALTVKDMGERMRYIHDCGSAYPSLHKGTDPDKLPLPQSLISAYEGEIRNRLLDFVERHGLLDKFRQEDQAGKR